MFTARVCIVVRRAQAQGNCLNVTRENPCYMYCSLTGGPKKVELIQSRHPTMTREQILIRPTTNIGATLDEQLTSALSREGAQGFDVILDAVSGPMFQVCIDPKLINIGPS